VIGLGWGLPEVAEAATWSRSTATAPRPPSHRNPGQEAAAAGASDGSPGPMPGWYTPAGRACRACWRRCQGGL